MNPPPAKVLPVAAEMVTVADHPQGTATSSAKFFRDADSRTRVEQGDIAVISDPVKGESYVLKMADKIAIPAKPAQPEPKLPNPALPLPKPPPLPKPASLGEKVIDGVKVQGKRYTMPQPPKLPDAPEHAMPPPPTVEVWTSPELQLPIQTSTIDPKSGAKSVTELRNIRQNAKLEPSLFEVPKDFKIAPPPVPGA